MEENKKTIELTSDEYSIIFLSLLSRKDALRKRIDNCEKNIKILIKNDMDVDPIYKDIIKSSEKEIAEVENLIEFWRKHF